MNPKSGTQVNAINPIEPELEAKEGEEKPFNPNEEPDEEEELSWIEIELVGEDDEPIPGERYAIELPDGRVDRGTLDNKGFKRLEGIPKGECKITFPNLDKDAWEPI